MRVKEQLEEKYNAKITPKTKMDEDTRNEV